MLKIFFLGGGYYTIGIKSNIYKLIRRNGIINISIDFPTSYLYYIITVLISSFYH